jgi:hypothetical protein
MVVGVNDTADHWSPGSLTPPKKVADPGHFDLTQIHTLKSLVPDPTSIYR